MEHEKTVFYSLEQIEKQIVEKITVENIARSVNYSKYHYSRLFREIVGSSVMEYVTKRRLTLAGNALLETDYAIVDIAFEYGFKSREGFSRSFKAYMGVSPSNYRKYRLTTISQNVLKEKAAMSYSKVTDEIKRELNAFVAKAKETAESARRAGVNANLPQPFMEQFWIGVADKTDEYADRLQVALLRVDAITECSDEISRKMDILKIIEETAQLSSIMAFHVGLLVARSQPEYLPALEPIADKYIELARLSGIKSEKTAQFMSELAELIIKDMRDVASQKIRSAVKAGEAALQSINGYEYIKNEIARLTNELSDTPFSEITAEQLSDFQARLYIIQFSIETDILRGLGRDKAMLDAVTDFNDKLCDAGEFFKLVRIPENAPSESAQQYSDIVFQGNILFFYTRGEIEKMTAARILSDEQTAQMRLICDEIDAFIKLAQVKCGYRQIAEAITAAHIKMSAAADGLGVYGGPMRFIAQEVKKLADSVTPEAND